MTSTLARSRASRWFAVAFLASAAGCSSSSHPGAAPPLDDGALADDTAVDGPDASGDASGDARDGAAEAGDATTTDSSVLPDGATTDSTPGDAPAAAPICNPTHTWTAFRDMAPDAIARFGGVSATGLTASWTRLAAGVVSADRKNESSAFAAPLPTADVALAALARVALDATGNQLAAVSPDGANFLTLSRANASSKWGVDAASASFDPLVAALPAGAKLSEPVFSASGSTFLFLVTVGTAAPVLYESRWNAATSAWKPGVPIADAGLASADATHRRRPTGMSADDLTLFFFDEAAGIERAAWRLDTASSFSRFVDLSGFPEAAPNAGCTFLYFKALDTTAGSAGIFAAQ